jgi:hypothetical protein
MIPCTYIDGIASSQAIDTAGEVVDLKGLDISSLVGAALNWEHHSDVPAQIVGKILEAHKIFSKEDCQNERHLKFWNKCQIPFLYIAGRLFDDKKPSAIECAALFHDDAEHPNEHPMVGFSIEGSRLGEKAGMVVPRSIARKVTITNMNANKTCVAEVLPKKTPKGDTIESLFKGEMEIFQFEPTYLEIMEKREALSKDVGSGGGAFIGGSMAMSEASEGRKAQDREDDKDTLSSQDLGKSAKDGGWTKELQHVSNVGQNAGLHFSHPEHGHIKATKTKIGNFEVRHNDKLMGMSPSAERAGKLATKLMNNFGKLKKAMEAGSALAAPNMLTGVAALTRESLDKKKMKKELEKKEKSEWYNRAHEAYNTWDKKSHFKDYMKKKMPHLAEGEIDAIGKVLALKKTVKAEGKLSKMYASYFSKDEK